MRPAPQNVAPARPGKAFNSAARGAEAVADQVTFSASTLAINIVLARWLAPEEYGAFSLAYSFLLLGLACHQAYVQQPLLVLGSGRYRGTLLDAWRYLAPRQALVVGALGIAGIGIFAFISLVRTGDPFMGLAHPASAAVSAVGLCSMHYFRSTWHVLQQFRHAIFGGLAYLSASLVGLVLLSNSGVLKGPTALLWVGVSGGSVALVWLGLQRRRLADSTSGFDQTGFAQDVHSFGRWALPAQLASWGLSNGPYLVVGSVLSVGSVGSFRAATNLLLPFLHVMVGLSSWFLPRLSLLNFEQGRLPWKELKGLLGMAATLGVGYGAAILFLGNTVANLLYGDQYDLDELLRFGSILPPAWAITSVTFAALRAAERPRTVFLITTAGLIAAVPLMTGAALAYGPGPIMAIWGITQLALALAAALTLFATPNRDREGVN